MSTTNSWNNTISAANSSITLNSGTHDVLISTDASATTVNIATGAGAKAVTLGSTNTTSSLALQYGTADFTIASASGTTISALDTGQVTMPLQPCFLSTQTTDATAVTGDGTTYTIGSATALTIIFDVGSNFTTAGVFTAPVTGKYLFCGNVQFSGLLSTHTQVVVNVFTTNRTLRGQGYNVTSGQFVNIAGYVFSVQADMTAGDTMYVYVIVNGGTLTANIQGSGNYITTVGGRLLA